MLPADVSSGEGAATVWAVNVVERKKPPKKTATDSYIHFCKLQCFCFIFMRVLGFDCWCVCVGGHLSTSSSLLL